MSQARPCDGWTGGLAFRGLKGPRRQRGVGKPSSLSRRERLDREWGVSVQVWGTVI